MAQKVNISDFRLHEILGSGSFGTVYHAGYKLPPGGDYAVKCMPKREIILMKQVDHINAEKDLMGRINFPFIVNMMGYGKDDRYLYIVMELITGGELFTHLRSNKRFENCVACFYAASMGACFHHLHVRDIVHRDLKPENILMVLDGYIKLTDFGFAKIVPPGTRTNTLCGTPEYLAPEVLLNRGHSKPVDWWTLGILIYEMCIGQPPFCDQEPMGIYQKILTGKVYFPRYFDREPKSLTKKLLVADLSRRYGNLKSGANDVLEHKWFFWVQWDKMVVREVHAPYKPSCRAVEISDNAPIAVLKPVQAVCGSNDPFEKTMW